MDPYADPAGSPLVTGKGRGFFDSGETEELVGPEGKVISAARDELLVVLKEDTTPDQYVEFLGAVERIGATIIGEDVRLLMVQLRIPADADEFALITEFEALDAVDGAFLNRTDEGVTRTRRTAQSNEEGVALYDRYGPSHLPETYEGAVDAAKVSLQRVVPSPSADDPNHPELWWVNTVELPDAWSVCRNDVGVEPGESVHIGIIDDGYEEAFGALTSGRVDLVGVVAPAFDPWVPPGRHGTWVTAFAAGDGGDGVQDAVGVAWDAEVHVRDVFGSWRAWEVDNNGDGEPDAVSLRTWTGPALADVIDLAQPYGESGHSNVIANLSMGPDAYDSEGNWKSEAVYRSDAQDYFDYLRSSNCKLARDNDVLVCNSMGNNPAAIDSPLPARRSAEEVATFERNFLLVAASDGGGDVAWFSSRGDAVDIVAPGDNVGVGIQMESPSGMHGLDSDRSGTSYSSPIAAGVAAMVRSIHPALIAPEVKQILLDSATPSAFSGDVGGAGLVNAKKAAEIAAGARAIPARPVDTILLERGDVHELSFAYTVPADQVIKLIDVMFVVDVSGSYYNDIATLTTKANEIMIQLSALASDVQFGVASFSDFPIQPYGDEPSGDRAYELRQTITAEQAAVADAIDALDEPLQYGRDAKESQLEALYQVVTGVGRDTNGDGEYDDAVDVSPSSSGWRTGALKVVVLATDAPFHDSDVEAEYPGEGFGSVLATLVDRGAVVIGIDSGDTNGDLQRITDATGGQLFELGADSAGIGDAILAGLQDRLSELTLSLKVVGDAWGFSSVEDDPSWHDVPAGETRTMRITLTGVKNRSLFGVQDYLMVIWVQAQNSAILERYPIRVRVPQWSF